MGGTVAVAHLPFEGLLAMGFFRYRTVSAHYFMTFASTHVSKVAHFVRAPVPPSPCITLPTIGTAEQTKVNILSIKILYGVTKHMRYFYLHAEGTD